MATKLSAKEDKLGVLHELTADYCLNRLREALNTGEPIPPAELGAITKFLKDNGIECVREDMQERFGEGLLRGMPDYDALPSYETVEKDFG